MRQAVLLTASLALGASALAQNTPAREPLPRDELQKLAAVYTLLREELPGNVDAGGLVRHAIHGMVRGADPQGEYYGPEEFKVLREVRPPDPAALGLEVRAKDNQLVLHAVAGGPAAEAGVRFGDVLHAVDSARTAGMSPQQVLQLLRGPAGSRVTLTVFRETTLTVEAISVERKAFVPARPSLTRAAGGAVVLRVYGFQDRTLQDVSDLLMEAWQKERFRAVVRGAHVVTGKL